jgi:hypothetical protein
LRLYNLQALHDAEGATKAHRQKTLAFQDKKQTKSIVYGVLMARSLQRKSKQGTERKWNLSTISISNRVVKKILSEKWTDNQTPEGDGAAMHLIEGRALWAEGTASAKALGSSLPRDHNIRRSLKRLGSFVKPYIPLLYPQILISVYPLADKPNL